MWGQLVFTVDPARSKAGAGKAPAPAPSSTGRSAWRLPRRPPRPPSRRALHQATVPRARCAFARLRAPSPRQSCSRPRFAFQPSAALPPPMTSSQGACRCRRRVSHRAVTAGGVNRVRRMCSPAGVAGPIMLLHPPLTMPADSASRQSTKERKRWRGGEERAHHRWPCGAPSPVFSLLDDEQHFRFGRLYRPASVSLPIFSSHRSPRAYLPSAKPRQRPGHTQALAGPASPRLPHSRFS